MDKLSAEEKLLNAALKLFSEKGYVGATTRKIAQTAGVAELTLFRHFGTKERLFEEVLIKYSFLPELKELLPELELMPYGTALDLMGKKFLDNLQERKTLVRIVLSEVNIYPEKMRVIYLKFVEELINTMAGYLDYLQKKKIFREISPEIASRAFLGMIFSYFLSEEIMGGRIIEKKEADDMIYHFVNILVNGCRKEEPATVL